MQLTAHDNATLNVRTATAWWIYWRDIDPTVCRYQEPVTLARVLSEHRAAITAEPMEIR